MEFKAIVYTSMHGHTRRYAEMLAEKTGVPAVAASEAAEKVGKGSKVIYMGWIRASQIRGYAAAARDFDVVAVCGVGLCDTGTLLAEARKMTRVPENVPLFTLQGGMDRSQLKGINKMMISMLTKVMSKKKNMTPDDERKLALLKGDSDLVKEENLQAVLQAVRAGK